MRRSLILSVLLAAVLVLAVGCSNKPPRIPSKPMGPTLVQVSTSNQYTSFTTDPNKDKVLYVFDWKDGKADTTALYKSGDTAKATHTWADTGMYAIRVKAKDEKGNWSADWSDTLVVHVVLDTAGMNRPPDQPTKPGHTGNPWVDSVQYFTSSATDPDNDSVQIKFYFDEGQVSNYSPRVAPGTSVRDSVWYQNRGWKAVYAVAIDAKGDTSVWSPACSVYVDAPNVAPYAPSIITSFCPKRGIAGGPEYKFFANARHRYGDSVRYVFYFDGDSVTSSLFPQNLDGYVSWRPTGDTHTYVVKVKAVSQTGLANDTIPQTTFVTVGEGTVLWGHEEDYYASPALGTVGWRGMDQLASICGSREGILHIVDAYQSTELYPIAITDADEYQSSAAIGADGTIYVGNEGGAVYAFLNDSLKWSFGSVDTGLSMTVSPALGNGGIYCGGEDKKIHKLIDNGSSVSQAWSYTLRHEITSSPVITAAGKVIACDDSGYVYSLNDDGTLDWEIRTGDTVGITSSPAIASDGSIFVGTDGGRLLCIRGNSIAWPFETNPKAAISSSPVIGPDGNVWFTADDGKLYRLDAATGAPVSGWPIQITQTPLSCTPLICADGILYITDDDENLYAVNMSDGTIKWTTPLLIPAKKGNGGHPRPFSLDVNPSAVVDQYGIIYITTGSGMFAVAGRLSGTLAGTDWPMFRRDVRHTGKFGGRR